MIKKLIKIAIKTLAIIVVVAIVAVIGFMLAEPLVYNDFYSRDSQKEFATPGAGDDFIQQGFCSVDKDTKNQAEFISLTALVMIASRHTCNSRTKMANIQQTTQVAYLCLKTRYTSATARVTRLLF